MECKIKYISLVKIKKLSSEHLENGNIFKNLLKNEKYLSF